MGAILRISSVKHIKIRKTVSTNGFDIDVEKKVWDGCNWVEEVYAEHCTIVRFNITIHNSGTCNVYNISVIDTLPDSLEYADNATINGVPEEPKVVGNQLIWFFPEDLEPCHKIYIEFDAHVIGEPCSIDVNWVEVTAETYDSNVVTDRDSAKVIIPGMCCEKKVWDRVAEEWVEETVAFKGELVKFKITVTYYGAYTLYNIKVKDILPSNLEYADNADPEESHVSDDKKLVFWNLTDELHDGESVEITFYAKVVGYGECINVANITADECSGEIWYCEDTAKVNTEQGMIVEKEVWDPNLQAWMEEIEAAVGDTVRFRISIYYYGTYTLYNIRVRDDLPECLEYADNADPEETAISGDGRTIWWNLSVELSDGESTIIEFDTIVTETSGCGPCINLANVTANECSGIILYWEDSATVNATCPLVADAGGPYFGEVGENINLVGSAIGGKPPYTFAWDLDSDGDYDDATGESVTYSWDEPGTYVISLKVTDDSGKSDTDDTTVTIENDAPSKPTIIGPSSGRINKEYTYTASATDPNGDQIYYFFDWGDGTNSGWLGPYNSGETVSATHTWTEKGNYVIKVKAKDVHDAESDWAELPVSMPLSKSLLVSNAAKNTISLKVVASTIIRKL
jgi:fimbrial isopeptide formation D2 family protein/uncharacterized repeat protein (TIGR01451 family)